MADQHTPFGPTWPKRRRISGAGDCAAHDLLHARVAGIVESRLLGRGFFKVHHAYLVNLQLHNGQDTMIPLSKQSEKELQELLGY